MTCMDENLIVASDAGPDNLLHLTDAIAVYDADIVAISAAGKSHGGVGVRLLWKRMLLALLADVVAICEPPTIVDIRTPEAV
jgi:hypothetical protein